MYFLIEEQTVQRILQVTIKSMFEQNQFHW